MKLLHTSDWHLGHTLRERSRAYEHAAFLAWLLDTVEQEQVDALLVSGDVFETANPSAEAQAQWFDFLASTRARFPDLEVIVIGGNHDSAARLDAPSALLRALRLRVVGGLPRGAGRALDLDRVVVPVRGRGGERAWIAAVPFLRASDLPVGASIEQLAEGVAAVYGEIVEHARRQRGEREAIVAMGHLYMVGGTISEESERKILGGNQHALPLEVFSTDVAYGALGHLHLAQRVGKADHVRYSGAPIALSMAEASYPHQVAIVELDGAGVRDVRPLRVPQAVELRRIPAKGASPLAQVLRELAALPAKSALAEERHLFVEVVVSCDGPEPGLVEKIGDALADRAAFLVKVTREVAAHVEREAAIAIAKRDYTTEEVFLAKWQRDNGTTPAPEYVQAFHELVDAAGQEPQ